MSNSQSLGGQSRCGKVLGPYLDKIIKNAAWRKHSHLVSSCKSVLDKLDSIADDPDLTSSVFGFSASDADAVLVPLILSLETSYTKVVEPALDCCFKLFSFNLLRGQIVSSHPESILHRLTYAVCKVCGIGEEAIELAVLRVLLAAVRSPCVLIRGDCLLHVVRTCYNVYLGGLTGTNQICAKSVLAQMMLVVFTRAEEDSMDVTVKTVSVGELLAFTDKNVNEGNSVHFCQGFVNEFNTVNEGAPPLDFKMLLQDDAPESPNSPAGSSPKGDADDGVELGAGGSGRRSKIRNDAFLLFKNLCKLSMKFSSQENHDDQILVRGKTLSLELLKVVIDNAGPIWRTNQRFLNAIKQYLCLSLLKNSALSVMSIFQLQCAIFVSLLTKFRSSLKEEIGIFFPMLVLRVLENVLQPSFMQKMTVLNLLEKISQDPQLIVDIFVNYDCDVDSPNVFERIVNGLLKTALGPPPGSSTTLSTVQDVAFRHESVKCLVGIIKAMGTWMDQQLKIGDLDIPKISQVDASTDNQSTPTGEEGSIPDYELHPYIISESSKASTVEQRRAYKIELQKGIKLFNKKPSKGIEFLMNTKKVGRSPEEVASFLKNTAAGLDEVVIGDYLGEREDFALKVMHAYVDSFNFKGMDFGEAIRFFLRGFRLPGEAQKIDRIMEKFAERYCKCSPDSFASADTAYVLAYSVIMLNTDAHNSMVKDKMSKADFLRNNRGIDDGKDLSEAYLGAIYDNIVRNEIKMKSDSFAPQSKQESSLNKLLGLDGILSLVWNQTEEKPLGANGLLIKHIQEQFKAKSGKSESVYHAITDIAILRFMVEVSWGPTLAAFSVMLDQTDDRVATSQCLQGFRYAVHVTAVMGMETQRDAFVTSMAKFTNLHCAADMKQKNVDALKAIITIAIEDGNHLQESWEHILTCLSRIEHLQLLGEGPPTGASFLSVSSSESDEKRALGFPNLKKKGALQNPAVMAVVRGGSYDSNYVGVNALGLVTPEQINNFISNLNLLDQIGSFELNHVFAHSQRLNGEAIVAFVKALCKVSMSELQSPTDPRVFSLTKLVEIAHYNMNRIRLVWSRIWNVLSDFFVSVGLSENLSVAIFVMDSLRQLAMKFLEREELANYNFQNEFLRPFVIVMQKSNSAEIRELILRCISQMVLSRVGNVKSGWKSVFTVFIAAATDERKNIVLLAFETMEKIVREYFSFITETETTAFTDCVRCLIAFTNSRFDSDVSLNAIAFLRFCALKLSDGGLVWNKRSRFDGSTTPTVKNADASIAQTFTDVDEHASYWVPLLTGLSKLTSDPRPAIRKSSLEVLFNILKDHGHLFSRPFWIGVFSSVIFPIFNSVWGKSSNIDKSELDSPSSVSFCNEGRTWDEHDSPSPVSPRIEESSWDSETAGLAARCLVDLFVSFFSVVRSQLASVVSILTGFIRSPVQGPASIGIAALLRLADELGNNFSEDEWREIFLALKEAESSTLASYMKVLSTVDAIDLSENYTDAEVLSDQDFSNDEMDDDNLQIVSYVISRTKNHISVQLLILQVVTDLYRTHQQSLSAAHFKIVIEIFASITSHAYQLNSLSNLHRKFQKACFILEVSEPPMLNFENESYQSYLNILQDLVTNIPSVSNVMNLESELVTVCVKVFEIYLKCTAVSVSPQLEPVKRTLHMILPLGSMQKEELACRTSLLVSALNALSGLERGSFKRYVSSFFPLLVELVKSEHISGQVPWCLSKMFESCIGPIIVE